MVWVDPRSRLRAGVLRGGRDVYRFAITGVPTNWLGHRALTHRDRLAVRDADRELTFGELHAAASGLAAVLDECGVGAGERIALELAPGVDHAIALHAALRLGAIAQSLPPSLPPAERERALRECRPALLVDRALLAEVGGLGTPSGTEGANLAGAGRPSAPDDRVSRVLTSGTSGEPKAVELTRANHLWSAIGSAFNLGVDPDDVWLCCLPLSHVAGLAILIRSAIYGTAALIHDRFDVAEVAAALERREATVVSLVPTQLRRLVDAEAPIDRPRAILLGGGPVADELLAEAAARGARVVHTYGLTEACSQVAMLALVDANRKRGSVGKPSLGTEVAIEGEEIVVRGPTVAPAAADEDGWLRTGDRGRIDEQGFLWVEGRLDDLIVTGGENVAPQAVEAALLRHPAVADAAVVGREDPEWGRAVTAIVVPAPDAELDLEELRAHCRRELAAHQVPQRLELTGELPRTASGKLRRRLLR